MQYTGDTACYCYSLNANISSMLPLNNKKKHPAFPTEHLYNLFVDKLTNASNI